MDILTRMGLAKNPNTSPKTLTFLSQDGFWGVRWQVAVNSATPYGIWVPNSGGWIPIYGRVLP